MARAAARSGQPEGVKRLGARATAGVDRRDNVAGAPYYRGLHW